MKQFILLLSLTISFTAHADKYGADAESFQKIIEQVAQECSFGQCKPGTFSSQELYSSDSPKKTSLKTNELAAFLSIAKKQAYIWMDTVLEGPYTTNSDTVLDSVIAISQNNKLVGYRISYSEKAWNTESCEYDSEDETSLKDCDQGTISEGTWVSPTLQTYFRDEDAIADFSD